MLCAYFMGYKMAELMSVALGSWVLKGMDIRIHQTSIKWSLLVNNLKHGKQ